MLYAALRHRGTWVLVKFFWVLFLFLLLWCVRIPLVLAVRILDVPLGQLNTTAARLATREPTGPLNQFTVPSPWEEATHVRA